MQSNLILSYCVLSEMKDSNKDVSISNKPTLILISLSSL